MIIADIDGIRVLRPEKSENSITNNNEDFYSQEIWLGKDDDIDNYREVLTPIDDISKIF